MASIAVPGVFPPRETSGSYLVDGGLSNPTPASSLVSMGADKLIAVDFMLKLEKLKKEPGLFSILMHSYEIIRAQNSRVKLDAIDKEMIIIKPDIRKAIDSFKFYDIVKFVQAGEKAVEEKMEEIKK
jgi:NTE family protein